MITCDPSIYIMDHPDFIVCSFMEISIGLKRVEKRVVLYGPRREKTCLLGFRQSEFQTDLLSYRD